MNLIHNFTAIIGFEDTGHILAAWIHKTRCKDIHSFGFHNIFSHCWWIMVVTSYVYSVFMPWEIWALNPYHPPPSLVREIIGFLRWQGNLSSPQENWICWDFVGDGEIGVKWTKTMIQGELRINQSWKNCRLSAEEKGRSEQSSVWTSNRQCSLAPHAM